MTENVSITFSVDNEDVGASVEKLMATDVTEIEENYGPERLPGGTYHFKVKNAEVITREMAYDKKKDPDKKVDRGIYSFELEVLNVLLLKDTTLDASDYLGSVHYEGFTIFDFIKDTGKVKALMKQAGFVPPSNIIGDMLIAFINWEFLGVITQRKDRNNPDVVYSNLDLKACAPVATLQNAEPQQQVPPPVEQAQQAAGGFSFGR